MHRASDSPARCVNRTHTLSGGECRFMSGAKCFPCPKALNTRPSLHTKACSRHNRQPSGITRSAHPVLFGPAHPIPQTRPVSARFRERLYFSELLRSSLRRTSFRNPAASLDSIGPLRDEDEEKHLRPSTASRLQSWSHAASVARRLRAKGRRHKNSAEARDTAPSFLQGQIARRSRAQTPLRVKQRSAPASESFPSAPSRETSRTPSPWPLIEPSRRGDARDFAAGEKWARHARRAESDISGAFQIQARPETAGPRERLATRLKKSI
jgi:hypothetical protein